MRYAQLLAEEKRESEKLRDQARVTPGRRAGVRLGKGVDSMRRHEGCNASLCPGLNIEA